GSARSHRRDRHPRRSPGDEVRRCDERHQEASHPGCPARSKRKLHRSSQVTGTPSQLPPAPHPPLRSEGRSKKNDELKPLLCGRLERSVQGSEWCERGGTRTPTVLPAKS